ncbi:hypothetical protein R1flu_009272 [Riccia fluitans]|uniref:Brf1 TBP-binding domain-containing protein n=1 Tax=Riccia fluitans TaxID=41844 RepID=A0ABD1Z1L1_9MARC
MSRDRVKRNLLSNNDPADLDESCFTNVTNPELWDLERVLHMDLRSIKEMTNLNLVDIGKPRDSEIQEHPREIKELVAADTPHDTGISKRGEKRKKAASQAENASVVSKRRGKYKMTGKYKKKQTTAGAVPSQTIPAPTVIEGDQASVLGAVVEPMRTGGKMDDVRLQCLESWLSSQKENKMTGFRSPVLSAVHLIVAYFRRGQFVGFSAAICA